MRPIRHGIYSGSPPFSRQICLASPLLSQNTSASAKGKEKADNRAPKDARLSESTSRQTKHPKSSTQKVGAHLQRVKPFNLRSFWATNWGISNAYFPHVHWEQSRKSSENGERGMAKVQATKLQAIDGQIPSASGGAEGRLVEFRRILQEQKEKMEAVAEALKDKSQGSDNANLQADHAKVPKETLLTRLVRRHLSSPTPSDRLDSQASPDSSATETMGKAGLSSTPTNSLAGFGASWSGENWKDDWGPDQLTPPRRYTRTARPPPPVPPLRAQQRPRHSPPRTVRSTKRSTPKRLPEPSSAQQQSDSLVKDAVARAEAKGLTDPSSEQSPTGVDSPQENDTEVHEKFRTLMLAHAPPGEPLGEWDILGMSKKAKQKEALSVAKTESSLSKREAKTKQRRKRSAKAPIVSGTVRPIPQDAELLEDVAPPHEARAVPRLAHGLDRVLFNPSVHWVQDPHSRVYNFPPHLQTLPSVTEFAFERLGPYISSSRDESLHQLALQHRKHFAGSTSSLTGFLSHIYFLISGDRQVDTSTLSMAFAMEPRTFTPGIRFPAAVLFHHQRYSLSEAGQVTQENIGSSEHQADQSAECADANDLRTASVSEGDTSSGLGAATPVPPSIETRVDEMEKATAPVPPQDVPSADEAPKAVDFDTYAIDSGSGDPDDRRVAELNVLLWLGTMAEKFLTMPASRFTSLLRKNPVNESLVESKRAESYRYAKTSQFVMRAQLDCQDSRLPGTGVFDIKTRAVLPIRIDRLNYLENAGYLIRKMTGQFESFEREYYDLIRSAFLKYTFQARIGNMDGVFVAYHNTARMFGFQYIPVTEMEERIYGPGRPDRGKRIFEKCIGLLEVLCAEIVACFPGESVSCTVEARLGAGNLMLWIVPTNPDNKRIAELMVTVYHTLNGQAVNSKVALDNASEDWELHYRIKRSTTPMHKIWATFKDVRARDFTSILPKGVSKEEMVEGLARVDFGAGKGLDQVLPAPSDRKTPAKKQRAALADRESKTAAAAATAGGGEEGAAEAAETVTTPEDAAAARFGKPNWRVKFLRKLARRGWADMKREDDALATRRRIVFGVDMDEGSFPPQEEDEDAEEIEDDDDDDELVGLASSNNNDDGDGSERTVATADDDDDDGDDDAEDDSIIPSDDAAAAAAAASPSDVGLPEQDGAPPPPTTTATTTSEASSS